MGVNEGNDPEFGFGCGIYSDGMQVSIKIKHKKQAGFFLPVIKLPGLSP